MKQIYLKGICNQWKITGNFFCALLFNGLEKCRLHILYKVSCGIDGPTLCLVKTRQD